MHLVRDNMTAQRYVREVMEAEGLSNLKTLRNSLLQDKMQQNSNLYYFQRLLFRRTSTSLKENLINGLPQTIKVY